MDRPKKKATAQNKPDLKNNLGCENYLKARSLAYSLKKKNWQHLQRDNNIVGAAFGRRIAHDEITDEPALIIYVARKISRNFLPPSRLLPRRMYIGGDYIEVDVLETGPLYPLAFTARERPATAGISIGNVNEMSAGTLGSMVIDNFDGSQCILSNNHVIARQNAATLGEMIAQPGLFDGGVSPADDIASLRRFVTINATGNTVDGAIASIVGRSVTDSVHDGIIDVATSDHPAIGLLFAGSCNRTIMNPIRDVLAQLSIGFPGGSDVTATAEIGMNVEKVGRTTEYTTSTVTEIDATVTINYDFGPATFDNQITTAWMSDRGDSGSVVYRGGDGGNVSKCGACDSASSASSLLEVNLDREQGMAKIVRDQFLRHTRIGAWAIDLFYKNEERALDRLAATEISYEDREFAKKMYEKHREEAYAAFCEGEKSDKVFTQQHLKEVETAFSRARKYLQPDEIQAGEKLLELAKQYALGKNVRQALAMLNDEKIAEQLADIIRKVKFIKHGNGCKCCK